MKKYSVALHIFRRDLRLEDNSSLIEALKSSESVIPCFIFDKRQIENNAFRSENCIQFMSQSLRELTHALHKHHGKLYFFYGIAEEVVEQLIRENEIKAVFVNRDYTPFSQARDLKIEQVCKQFNIDFHAFSDALLHEPEEVLKPDNTPYTVFTHFYNKASQLIVDKPRKNNFDNYYRNKIVGANDKLLQETSHNEVQKGGRAEGLKLLAAVTHFKNYNDTRNFPALNGTTRLSAHNKFGTISIREFYNEIINHFGKSHTLIKELYWRDFFTHIAYHFPHVFEGAFHKKYNTIPWSENNKYFLAWCNGQTGFPIVDAGMRELNKTGFMHNRVRMITASFLVKDLHINWQWGEKYFAQHLVDYDPSVNNGNWQWSASTGCDAQPYFRIFNPWLQQKKFDADCEYIKKWVPELKHISADIIHNPITLISQKKDYPNQIVDHSVESSKSKLMYNLKN